ncbi:MAG: hypothetical protein HON47_03240 [Candidatus Diapherotrites archaeon]|jgi:hypothetical protein|uniref:Uncharacterized protein n=1 Tax=Candidatus Iainarchaeum sp. TaxID=3101447 RepID=A0A8T5GF16_9ARCH|nr:hypothetical protein [Candidatus Diapherotrites archaeon]
MPKARSGNSVHRTNARKGQNVASAGTIGAKRKATVFDWEAASRKERAFKARASKEALKARTLKTRSRKRKKTPGTVLSELEFVHEHSVPKRGFNQMIRGMRKLHKLRERDRRTKGKVIVNPEVIAGFLRGLKEKEAVNLPEPNIVAFSNWAIGKDPTKLKAIR